MWFLLVLTLLLSAINLFLLRTTLSRLKKRVGEGFDDLRKDKLGSRLNRIEKSLGLLDRAVTASLGPQQKEALTLLHRLGDEEEASSERGRHGLMPVLDRPARYADSAKRIDFVYSRQRRAGGSPHAHSERKVTAETLRKVDNSYAPTYDGFGDYIDAFHQGLGSFGKQGFIANIHGVEGNLRIADALKIYELAYFAEGNILELGSFRGLSTCIESAANHASGLRHEIVSVDLSPDFIAQARENLESQALGANVSTLVAEAADGVRLLHKLGLSFQFAFVDHSHRYEHVLSAVKALPGVLAPGAFVLFHDYYDPRNFAQDDEYGVVRGIEEAIGTVPLAYWGCYGCCGLFRYQPE